MKRILALFMAFAIAFSNGVLMVFGEESSVALYGENDANSQIALDLGSSPSKAEVSQGEIQPFGAKQEDELYNTFKNPPSEKMSRPLWFWNSKGKNLSNITKEGIRDIMEKSVTESNYAGFGILPNYLDRYLMPTEQ